MTKEMTVRKLARRVMDYADRKDWGLGECRFELNKWALDEVENCDVCLGFDDRFDKKFTGDEACSGDHEAHIKEARSLASDAYNLACDLEDRGVRTFA